ncbi:hypothetical protein CGZ90_08765 [Fictibacillus aquaticus]|uniref:Uncharacterized protein n=1 Tax=Fictibacillus aquaticus TaxID=2021314 RepID=A0A235F9P1_9BACL|nr:hypothetical protein CGZ90_08765 [Fictibacillus aquaticus]
MKKMVKNWICPKCKCLDKEAYKEALQDYGLLISPMITNFEFRDFLHIQSIHVASKMLLRLKLPASGHTKGRKYKIPLN